jgi:hypothetical protein
VRTRCDLSPWRRVDLDGSWSLVVGSKCCLE